MTDITAATITITLTYHEARAVRTALRNRAKKFERAMSKGEFKPEHGKLDRNQLGPEMNSRLAGLLDQALTAAVEKEKAANRPSH